MPLTHADQLVQLRSLGSSLGVGVVLINTAHSSAVSALSADFTTVALASSTFGQWKGGTRRPV